MMRYILQILLVFIGLSFASVTAGEAQEESGLSALARYLPEASAAKARFGGAELRLGLSQPVPYRIYTLDAPRRLVIDFSEVDWRGAAPEALEGVFPAVRFGGLRPGWSRFVAELAEPLALESAAMTRDAESGAAQLLIRLDEVSAEAFAAKAGMPPSADWPAPVATAKPKEDGILRVVLDPGHGGIDPGASRDGLDEKELMLIFAREIEAELLRLPNVDVVLTREDDSFVSLERRVAIAHQVEADLFISLHADALSEGRAHGATVHTLSSEASDKASALLVERHDRADMLAGIDLSGQDDEVTGILLDLARQETQPRSEALARAVVEGLKGAGAPLNRRPYRSAAFSVLKAADIPSVLLEIGFLSSERDFANVTDAAWRARMAGAIRDGIQAWVIADEALRRVQRR